MPSLKNALVFESLRFFIVFCAIVFSSSLATADDLSGDELRSSVWNTQYVRADGEISHALVSIPDGVYWTSEFRGKVVNLDIAMNEGGEGVVVGSWEALGTSGKFSWGVSVDGQTFEGRWSDLDGNSYKWTGKRVRNGSYSPWMKTKSSKGSSIYLCLLAYKNAKGKQSAQRCVCYPTPDKRDFIYYSAPRKAAWGCCKNSWCNTYDRNSMQWYSKVSSQFKALMPGECPSAPDGGAPIPNANDLP